MNEFLVSIGPAVGNHLWQSTVFAVAAGALAVLLKKNQAKTRYWIWLAASIKFLVPFSLLIGVGSMLPRLQHAPVVAQTAYSAMDTVSEPFAESVLPVTATYAPRNERHATPEVIASVWLCGLVVVVLMWWRQWSRVAVVAWEATEADGGREMDVLRRLEQDAGMRPMRLLLTRSSLEPGVFGAMRPALVWPVGISARLTDEQMEAIVAHELCHVRRRDNLFAMVHMLVEAAFWFHPLVWWMGARMVEERERACDEEVLGRGSDAEVYAESVLKICRFCLESPLACVSGITGADLKGRIVQIMSMHLGRRLGLGKKAVLVTAVLVAMAGPVLFGLVHMIPMTGVKTLAAQGVGMLSVHAPAAQAATAQQGTSDTGKLSPAAVPSVAQAQATVAQTQLQQLAAEIRVSQIQTAVAQDQLEVDRFAELMQKNIVSIESYQAKVATLDTEKAALTKAQAQATVAQTQLQQLAAEIRVSQIQTAVAQDQLEVDRFAELMQKNIVSIESYQAKVATLDTEKAALTKAQAQVLTEQDAVRKAQALLASAQSRAEP